MWAGRSLSSATSSARSPGESPGGGLVEEDEARRPREGHADLELALLAVGQRATGWVATWVSRARSRSSVAGPFLDDRMKLKRLREDAAHRQEQVVAHREVTEQQRGLVGASHPHADALVGRHARHVLAEEQHPAARRVVIAGDDVEQVVLPAPFAPMTARRSPAAIENGCSRSP